MSKLIVVVGATGNQGGSVVRTFANEPGWRVRGITRDPNKPSAQTLATSLGVELVAADLDDPASLRAAFAGAHAIFGVTDFWQFAQDPATHQLAAERGVQAPVICYEKELAQARNIIDAAASVSGLERFVFSTLSDTKRWSDNTITLNYHFDGKAAASAYLDATHPALAAVTSSLQVGMYMSNWRISTLLAPVKRADGKGFVLRKPSVPDAKPVPWVHPPQDTGPFVRALVLEAPARTTMLGGSQMAGFTEYCELWTRVMRERGLIGAEQALTEERLTFEAAEATMPGGFGSEVCASMRYCGQYGWTGGDPSVRSPEECGVDMAALSSLEDFIRTEDWSDIFQ